MVKKNSLKYLYMQEISQNDSFFPAKNMQNLHIFNSIQMYDFSQFTISVETIEMHFLNNLWNLTH